MRHCRYTKTDMRRTGTIRGAQIELEEPVNLPEGTRVRLIIQPVCEASSRPLIGLFREHAELIDALVEAIMNDRETRPLRVGDGQNDFGY